LPGAQLAELPRPIVQGAPLLVVWGVLAAGGNQRGRPLDWPVAIVVVLFAQLERREGRPAGASGPASGRTGSQTELQAAALELGGWAG